MKSINLNEYIDLRHYSKTETYTQAEVIEAINNLTLVHIVTELPTTDIKNNRIYLVVNELNVDDATQKHNRYDLYIYVDGKWEQIDSLEFNIENYPRTSDVTDWLETKADIIHGHPNATSSSDGFMPYEDKAKLDTVETNANYTVIDTTWVNNSDNPVASKIVKTALDGKAPVNHKSANNTYGVADKDNYGHVKASMTVPPMNSTNGSVGTDNGLYARADHTHPTDTSRASTSGATTSSAGLMSASDKTKLNGLNLATSMSDDNKIPTASLIKNYIDSVGVSVTVDDTVTENSSNPVKSSGIKSYVDSVVANKSVSESEFLTLLNTAITGMNNVQ